jgi:hypothetical protein
MDALRIRFSPLLVDICLDPGSSGAIASPAISRSDSRDRTLEHTPGLLAASEEAAVFTHAFEPAVTGHQEAVTGDARGRVSAGALVAVRVGWWVRTHVRDSWIHDLYLTDHELYV